MTDKITKVFIGFHRDSDGMIDHVLTGTKIEDVSERDDRPDRPYQFVEIGVNRVENPAEASDDKGPIGSNDASEHYEHTKNQTIDDKISDICFSTMKQFDAKITPFHQLIELTNFMRQGLQRSAIDHSIYDSAKKSGNQVISKENFEVYELSVSDFSELQKSLRHMQEIDEGMQILPSSILLSLVATFDSIIADFCKSLLQIDSKRLESRDKSISYRELLEINDVIALKDRIIQDEVDELLRGSHQKQVAYFEKLVDTEIIKHHSRWPNFIEVFERRNVYAHASGYASASYIDNLSKVRYPTESLELGKTLKLSTSYLHKSVDYLTEFGTLLTFVAWKKLGIDPSKPFGALSEASFAYLSKRRFKLATWLLDFAIHKQSRKGVSDIIIRRMIVNLANAYKKMDDQKNCDKILSEIDWTACSLAFRLAICSLREDVPQAVELLPKAFASGDVNADQIRTWPVYDWIRENEEFRRAFEQTFDQKLIEDKDSPAQDMRDNDAITEENDSIH